MIRTRHVCLLNEKWIKEPEWLDKKGGWCQAQAVQENEIMSKKLKLLTFLNKTTNLPALEGTAVILIFLFLKVKY